MLALKSVGAVSESGTGGAAPAPARSQFCSWESFHLSTIGASALHTAAWDSSHEIVQFLLEAGQDPDTSDSGGLTTMMVPLLRYNLVAMRCVFQNSAVTVRRNVVVDCREEESRLQKQVLAVIELLIRFGANVDNRSQEGSSALHYVANSDAFEVARVLLDAGADIDAQDQNGMTPLHHCIKEGSLLVANLLVSRGAQIDLQDIRGVSSLELALKQRSGNVLQIILNHHHMVATSQRRDFAADVLLSAVELESEEAVRLIVDGGYAPVIVQNSAGETPLHRAIAQRNTHLMALLVSLDLSGESLTMATTTGDSPAHYAARYGSLRVVETLLQQLHVVVGDLRVIDEETNPLNAMNHAGERCLYIVGTDRVSAGTLEERDAIVEFLLRHGARLFPRDRVVRAFGSGLNSVVIFSEPVHRALTLWIQEISDRHQGMDAEDEIRARGVLLTDFCVEWIASVATSAMPGIHSLDLSGLSAVLSVAIAAGYASQDRPRKVSAIPGHTFFNLQFCSAMAGPAELLPRWLVDHHVPEEAAAVPARIRLTPYDDGFTPSGCNSRPGKIVRDFPRDHPGAFAVLDGAVSEQTADLLYASAVKATVWGVYVSVDELQLEGAEQTVADAPELKREETEDPDAYRHALARRTVQEFLVMKDGGQRITKDDWQRTHGVAVWVIASDCDDETEYHLDYAEQVRYESNVIFPPIYGATLHVSPLHNCDGEELAATRHQGRETSSFEGGGFHANLTGLAHYDKYGYKTRKQSQRLTTSELEEVSSSEPGWERVPYAYRRGIICDGEFPHFSGRVRTLPASLTPPAGAAATPLPVKRVIVGFNLFPHEIGACVAKFPEHSGAFNRYVKLSQAAVKQTKLLSTSSNKGGWSLESVRNNPKQAAFLKLLARKVRENQKAANQASEVKSQ
ncbi:hypothetical protein PHYBOEH_011478 [Phytophthora boehmeriae]|uniref:Uncharacterized protein n=1 Tax=Phytophthora boehmeriae TaxID=109152 RepID=A0A8T1VGD6_9STRA|nr:hypothetical protein PHYBOEH_011478 [Phytophthora boehmeriae]